MNYGWNLEQKAGAFNGMPSPLMLAQQFMDPRPSAALNVNEPSVSDDKTRELSASPANTAEVISKELDHPLTKNNIPGKQVSNSEDGAETSQSWGSPKSPKLDHQPKNDEQVSEVPFRKARVSVRARSEAPLVINSNCNFLSHLFIVINIRATNNFYSRKHHMLVRFIFIQPIQIE